MLRLERDVGGVRGLSLLHDAFSEAVEEQLFAVAHGDPTLPRAQGATAVHTQTPWKDTMNRRFTDFFYPPTWPDDFWRIITCARTQGLSRMPIVAPNFVCGLAYPVGTRIGAHFDPVGTLGDQIIGVSLGRECQMYLTEPQKNGGRKITFQLPRRSIYLFEDDARYGWMHGTLQLEEGGALPPAWNPAGERRSLLFRTTTRWAQLALRERLPHALGGVAAVAACTDASIEERIARMARSETRQPAAKSAEQTKKDKSYAVGLAGLPWRLSFQEGIHEVKREGQQAGGRDLAQGLGQRKPEAGGGGKRKRTSRVRGVPVRRYAVEVTDS